MALITVSIPAYNDAPTIEPLIEDSIAAVSTITDDFEILVIDDGSRDETADILRRLCANIPRLRVHTHPENLGFGPTISEVYSLPTSEWVYFIPGDAQIPAETLQELWPQAPHYDFLLGRRRNRQDGPRRKFVSWCYNFLVTVVAGRRVRDVNSAGLLRRQALREITLHSRSGFIHAELLLELIRHGASFVEVDIHHRRRAFGEESGNKLSVILLSARELATYAVKKWLGRLR